MMPETLERAMRAITEAMSDAGYPAPRNMRVEWTLMDDNRTLRVMAPDCPSLEFDPPTLIGSTFNAAAFRAHFEALPVAGFN